ncbi:MAG: two-component system, OmpR family, sensor histidine kinase KdpD [Thermoleophilaceae bacterium]|jgi:two-component system sensor histidine kinase KdpD|nr:two-component system, OmpR family, sensor histidine kinase KdpD [Thermoleophilaceae bacterium]
MVWIVRLKDSLAFLAAATCVVGTAVTDGWAERGLIVLALAGGIAYYVDSRRSRAEAARRSAAAAAGERSAAVVAEAATALLTTPAPEAAVTPRLERALADVGARLQICHAPTPQTGELALPLRAQGTSGWLYVDRDGPLSKADAERLLGRISDLIGAAQERTRASHSAAETEAHRQADMAKTAVMHAISHDLRVPLAGLDAVAGALGDRQLSDDELADLARALSRETAELGRMVDDLLDLSRIEAGATNPQLDWCDLADLVGAAAERVRAQRGELAVTVTLPPDLPLVKADREQLERVFCNLLDNAAKFSPADQPVEVRGICANGRVTIRVLDHGRGIAPSQQSQVFKAFVRGSSPESGSGLGLAICRGFVEANGGRITLQSGSRDGSAFAVSFPTAEQPSRVH